MIFLSFDEMEHGYAHYIDSEWKIVYCEAVRGKINELSYTRCHGCLINHPSQTQHSCLMQNEEDDLFLYFTEALENLDEITVLEEFEIRLQKSDIPVAFRNIYKQKFYCKDWRDTEWKSEDSQCDIFDTIYRLIQLEEVF